MMFLENGRVLALLVLTLVAMPPQTLNAQNMETPENTLRSIRVTVENYFMGTTDGNIDALKKAFHKDCKIYSINESEELSYLNQKAFYEVVEANYKKEKRKNQILMLDVCGNTAFAKTRADYSQFAFLDYLTLLKINGEWKIVSKSTFNLKK